MKHALPRSGAWRGLPVGIWAMGFGSLFMDVSSELIHSLLPLFLVTGLGASMVAVGLIEGAAEAVAAVSKVVSGVLSDHLRRRKTLMVFGYALAAATKPMFPLATSVGWVFTARFLDRIGKGVRGAPRDALVAHLVSPRLRGAAFGLRQALDSAGAMLGPLLAVALMLAFADDIRRAMWFAVPAACVTVVVLLVFVHEPASSGASSPARPPLALAAARLLPRRYWLVVALGAVFTLARFSEAFLVLRGQSVGLPLGEVPLVMVVMNVLYAAGAYPAGALADQMRSRSLLLLGLAVLVGADLVLASAVSPVLVFVGAALWGGHMALTQGLLSKLVADTAPRELLGTGFGVFNLVSGGAVLLASLLAGLLWATYGPAATFLASAFFAAAAATGLLAVGTPLKPE